jgi:hypothetical protein
MGGGRLRSTGNPIPNPHPDLVAQDFYSLRLALYNKRKLHLSEMLTQVRLTLRPRARARIRVKVRVRCSSRRCPTQITTRTRSVDVDPTPRCEP